MHIRVLKMGWVGGANIDIRVLMMRVVRDYRHQGTHNGVCVGGGDIDIRVLTMLEGVGGL